MKNIDETRNYLIEEINRNELMNKKHKKDCANLNYVEHFPSLGSTITGCISISVLASLVGIPIGITSSAMELKICTITAALKKYKSMIQIKKKKQDKIVLLGKFKLNSIEALIPKVWIDSVISHDEFVLINNVLKEHNKMKEEIKNLKT